MKNFIYVPKSNKRNQNYVKTISKTFEFKLVCIIKIRDILID